FDERYVALMRELIEYTRRLFHKGMPLAKRVEGKVSVDLAMFSRGGLAVLDAIEAMGYDTLHHRPEVSKVKQVGLLGRALVTHVFGGAETNRDDGFARAAGRDVLRGASPADIAASYDQCHAIARSAHSSFYPAFFLLPKQKRDSIVALYAFNRLVDDVADEGEDVAAKQRSLSKWRSALDEAVNGSLRPGSAPGYAAETLPALVDTIRRHSMPTRYLHDLISGAEMDLTIKTYPTFDRLREYCYRVAGTVGLTCTHIFGFKDPRALDLAEKLGLAF